MLLEHVQLKLLNLEKKVSVLYIHLYLNLHIYVCICLYLQLGISVYFKKIFAALQNDCCKIVNFHERSGVTRGFAALVRFLWENWTNHIRDYFIEAKSNKSFIFKEWVSSLAGHVFQLLNIKRGIKKNVSDYLICKTGKIV